MKVYHIAVLICSSLLISIVQHLLMCSFVIVHLFVFSPFSYHVAWFLLLSFDTSFYILHTSHLLRMWFASISSCSVLDTLFCEKSLLKSPSSYLFLCLSVYLFSFGHRLVLWHLHPSLGVAITKQVEWLGITIAYCPTELEMTSWRSRHEFLLTAVRAACLCLSPSAWGAAGLPSWAYRGH